MKDINRWIRCNPGISEDYYFSRMYDIAAYREWTKTAPRAEQVPDEPELNKETLIKLGFDVWRQFDDPFYRGVAAETAYWDYRLEHEPDVVRTKVYNRILDVMQHPEENRNLFVKRVILRDMRLMSITEESGFYDKILAESKVIVPVNVEYIIDIENFRIDKVYHPEKGYSPNITKH